MLKGVKQEYDHIYRGYVTDNSGTKGQCKIFIPSVYPKEYITVPEALPWAEPAMSLFGGNFTATEGSQETETGIAGTPKVGAHVWVFFDEACHLNPVYFATIQGGDGWISEDNDQWTIQTDNVRIRIDESPEANFQTFNSKNVAGHNTQTDIAARVDIEITGNVNLVINGTSNVQINGDAYLECNGDQYESVSGNVYRKIDGDIIEEITGNLTREIQGTSTETIKGAASVTMESTLAETIQGAVTIDKQSTSTETIQGDSTITSSAGKVDITANTTIDLTAPQINLN